MKVVLHRLASSEAGTMGQIEVDGEFVCFTTELPWRHNARNVSCIPWGAYKLGWENSPKFGRRLHVLDVPERSHILLHAGNWQRNTLGCIMPCTMLDRSHVTKQIEGRASKIALDRLEELLPDDGTRYDLEITPATA